MYQISIKYNHHRKVYPENIHKAQTNEELLPILFKLQNEYRIKPMKIMDIMSDLKTYTATGAKEYNKYYYDGCLEIYFQLMK